MEAQKTKEKSRAHDKKSGMEICLYMGIVSVYSVYSAFCFRLEAAPACTRRVFNGVQQRFVVACVCPRVGHELDARDMP